MARMMQKAMRRPRPVLMKPRERKNAQTMSQIVPLPKPIKASFVFRMPKKAQSVSERKATAPIGMGCRMKPAMVATKTAKSFQAAGERPAGTGQNQMTIPSPRTMAHFLSAALSMINTLGWVVEGRFARSDTGLMPEPMKPPGA